MFVYPVTNRFRYSLVCGKCNRRNYFESFYKKVPSGYVSRTEPHELGLFLNMQHYPGRVIIDRSSHNRRDSSISAIFLFDFVYFLKKLALTISIVTFSDNCRRFCRLPALSFHHDTDEFAVLSSFTCDNFCLFLPRMKGLSKSCRFLDLAFLVFMFCAAGHMGCTSNMDISRRVSIHASLVF